MDYSIVLQKVGYADRAQKLLSEALITDSTDTNLMRMLARLYYEEMNFLPSSQYYDELLSIDPSNSNDHMMAARCAIKLKQADRATKHYKHAHESDPLSNKIIHEYAKHLQSRDRNAEALNLIEQCNLDVQHSQKFILLLGNIQYSLGDYKQAAVHIEMATAFQPDNVDLIKKLGFCYYADKQFDKAYHQFLLSEPYEDDPATYYYLGLCAQEIGSKKAAVVYLDKSLSLVGPNYLPHLYLVLGQCHHDLKEYPEAIKSFKEALDVTQNDGMIYYSLANTYNDFYADKSVAIEYYNKALEHGLPPEIEPYIKQQIQYLQNQMFFSE
jgi:tetratricopeptide (TPR) repeat protein